MSRGEVAGPASTTLVPMPVAHPAPGQCIANYRLARRIGSGGCGEVWLAEHQVIGTRVAIKILRPDISALPGIEDRFITEARATATIASPHVTRYLDLGRLATGEYYAIMEYLEGETLAARLEREGRLPIADALAIARQAAEALASAHAARIVHRDIKPDNIFLTGSDAIHVKLLDFGIAKVIGEAGERLHRTETGMFVGTLAYCAPEQLFGGQITPATDIYALGATLYEMVSGHPPFDTSAPDYVNAKLSTQPPRCADLPAALDELLARMLAPDASRRPQAMEDVLVALGHAPAACVVSRPCEPDAIEALEVAAPRPRALAAVAVACGGVVAVVTLVALLVVHAARRQDHVTRAPEWLVPGTVRIEAIAPVAAEPPAPAPVAALAVPAPPAPAPAPPAPARPARPRRAAPARALPSPAAPHAGDDVIIADPFR